MKKRSEAMVIKKTKKGWKVDKKKEDAKVLAYNMLVGNIADKLESTLNKEVKKLKPYEKFLISRRAVHLLYLKQYIGQS